MDEWNQMESLQSLMAHLISLAIQAEPSLYNLSSEQIVFFIPNESYLVQTL